MRAGQAFEPRLTAALAMRWPAVLPDVLAYEEERAWLLLGDAGARLGFDGSPEPWLSLSDYAELQQGETTHMSEHLSGSVPDRRIATHARVPVPLDARGRAAAPAGG